MGRGRQDEVHRVRQVEGEEPHGLGREVPDEAGPDLVARNREQVQAQAVQGESGQHRGEGDRAIPPEAAEHVAGRRIRLQEDRGREHPEEHGRGLIDGEGREQGQDRARRGEPPRAAAVGRLEPPLAQQEGEPGGERGQGKGRTGGPGRIDLEGQGGTGDHGDAGGREAAPAGMRQRLEHAPRQQGDAEHRREPQVAQALDVPHRLQGEPPEHGVDRTAEADHPLDVCMRLVGELGVVLPVAVIGGEHGSEAGEEDRQEEAGRERARYRRPRPRARPGLRCGHPACVHGDRLVAEAAFARLAVGAACAGSRQTAAARAGARCRPSARTAMPPKCSGPPSGPSRLPHGRHARGGVFARQASRMLLGTASWERSCPARKWDGRTAAIRCGRDTSVPRGAMRVLPSTGRAKRMNDIRRIERWRPVAETGDRCLGNGASRPPRSFPRKRESRCPGNGAPGNARVPPASNGCEPALVRMRAGRPPPCRARRVQDLRRSPPTGPGSPARTHSAA